LYGFVSFTGGGGCKARAMAIIRLADNFESKTSIQIIVQENIKYNKTGYLDKGHKINSRL